MSITGKKFADYDTDLQEKEVFISLYEMEYQEAISKLLPSDERVILFAGEALRRRLTVDVRPGEATKPESKRTADRQEWGG